jgi:hypothetical protein
MSNPNETQLDLELAPPKVRYLSPEDFYNNRFDGVVVDIEKVPSANLKGVTDVNLVLQATTGDKIKRKFSLWGENYVFVYNQMQTLEAPLRGLVVEISIDTQIIDGKSKTIKKVIDVRKR